MRSQQNHGVESDFRWQALQRILKTESFSKAPRLSSFLLYICERALLERTDEITEQQIGVHVFGRPANYNPGEDNIVRQTARQLRQRLALFYEEERRNETVHITIPRGGYIPVFELNDRMSQVSKNASGTSHVQLSSHNEGPELSIPASESSIEPFAYDSQTQSILRSSGGVFLFFGVVIGIVCA
jgi:hypothetical protein